MSSAVLRNHSGRPCRGRADPAHAHSFVVRLTAYTAFVLERLVGSGALGHDMPGGLSNSYRSATRTPVVSRLRDRLPEIESAIAARVMAIDPPTRNSDLEYLEGLRNVIPRAIEYALAVIEFGSDQELPIPLWLTEQTRLAARHSIGLESIQRRYIAGRDLLVTFLLEEFEAQPQREFCLKDRITSLAVTIDRALDVVAKEHQAERRRVGRTSSDRQLQQIRQLLQGKTNDVSDIAYDLDAVHVGIVAGGPGAAAAVRLLAGALDARLLLANPSSDRLWAWIGRRNGFEAEILRERLRADWPAGSPLSVGEPGHGPPGWRQTHRQALRVFWIALRRPDKAAWYARNAVLTSVAADDIAVRSLRSLYLDPLATGADGGASLRHTLRHYLDSGWNGSSMAAALGISRQSVKERLARAEERIGHQISACASDLDLALRLAELDEQSAPAVGTHPDPFSMRRHLEANPAPDQI